MTKLRCLRVPSAALVILILAVLLAAPVLAATTFGLTSTGSTSYPTSNFGSTSAGSSNDVAGHLYFTKATLSAPGTVTSISFYSRVSGKVKVGIYDDTGSDYPNNLLVGPVEKTGSTAMAWNTVTITATYLTAGTYWLAVDADTAGANAYYAGGLMKDKTHAYVTAWPTTCGADYASGAQQTSVYGTYAGIEGYAKATKATLADNNANITSVSFYSHATGNARLAIYSDSGSAPSSKLWESNSTAVSATAWKTINISEGTPSSLTLLQSGTYWLAWQWDSATSGPSYTLGSSGDGSYITQAYGSFPSSWGSTSSSEKWSIYATYTTINWNSYESDYSTPRETYDSGNSTVYMSGTGFQDISHFVAYYDDGGANRGSETKTASSGTLHSAYLLTSDPTAAAGTWHTLVQPSTGYDAFGGHTYAEITAAPTTYGLMANDSYTVEASAIPEFPTAFAAIGVAGLCFGIYWWMRKRVRRVQGVC